MARKKSKIDVLQNVWLFSACTSKELGRIASLVDEAEVPAGATLTKEGATGREFFAVADGKATAKIRGRKIASYDPGDFFGLSPSLARSVESSASAWRYARGCLPMRSRGSPPFNKPRRSALTKNSS